MWYARYTQIFGTESSWIIQCCDCVDSRRLDWSRCDMLSYTEEVVSCLLVWLEHSWGWMFDWSLMLSRAAGLWPTQKHCFRLRLWIYEKGFKGNQISDTCGEQVKVFKYRLRLFEFRKDTQVILRCLTFTEKRGVTKGVKEGQIGLTWVQRVPKWIPLIYKGKSWL